MEIGAVTGLPDQTAPLAEIGRLHIKEQFSLHIKCSILLCRYVFNTWHMDVCGRNGGFPQEEALPLHFDLADTCNCQK